MNFSDNQEVLRKELLRLLADRPRSVEKISRDADVSLFTVRNFLMSGGKLKWESWLKLERYLISLKDEHDKV